MTELVSEYVEGSHGRDAEYHGADEVAQCWLYQLVFLGLEVVCTGNGKASPDRDGGREAFLSTPGVHLGAPVPGHL